jgi:Asp/Glu/hydantoin racemase
LGGQNRSTPIGLVIAFIGVQSRWNDLKFIKLTKMKNKQFEKTMHSQIARMTKKELQEEVLILGSALMSLRRTHDAYKKMVKKMQKTDNHGI